MSIFDQFTFDQRAYALQQLQTLLETLKEVNFRDRLAESTQVISVGGPSMQDVEERILAFALNHFGMPYSHEVNETEEKK